MLYIPTKLSPIKVKNTIVVAIATIDSAKRSATMRYSWMPAATSLLRVIGQMRPSQHEKTLDVVRYLETEVTQFVESDAFTNCIATRRLQILCALIDYTLRTGRTSTKLDSSFGDIWKAISIGFDAVDYPNSDDSIIASAYRCILSQVPCQPGKTRKLRGLPKTERRLIEMFDRYINNKQRFADVWKEYKAATLFNRLNDKYDAKQKAVHR